MLFKLTQGIEVEIFGLKSKHGQTLNGTFGSLRYFIPQTKRWAVQIGETTNFLKTESIQRVTSFH